MSVSTAEEPLAVPGPGQRRPPSVSQLHQVIAAQSALACAPPEADKIFGLLAGSARELMGAEGALAAQPVDGEVVARASTGSTGSAPGTVVPAVGTMVGLALRTLQPQLCRDCTDDPRICAEISTRSSGRSSVVVPLVHGGVAVGLVVAMSSRPHAFDESDVERLAMLADVGAHRLAHAVSREHERQLTRRLAAAQHLTGLATWSWEPASDRHGWSEQMFRLVGLEPGSAPPDLEGFLTLVHPEDREACRRLAHGQLQSSGGYQQIYRVIHPDGQVHHLQSWTDVERDPDGRVVRVSGATLDVSERERATQALSASEQHFRIAFDNAPIGMSMISLVPETAGRYLRANAAFCRMLGYTPDEISGLSMADLTNPADIERDTGRMRSILLGETSSVSFEKHYVRKDGATIYAWLTSAVVKDAHGSPLYLITHAMDVTERRKEQAELERLALTDTLTGLANRTLLNDRVDQALARLHRVQGGCALLLLDIDRFKLVNDSLGHQVGDALLVEVANRLQAVSRADATVARLGGDEFVVLVEGLPAADDVRTIAQRLLDALRRPYSLPPPADSLVATVSIGISVAGSPERSASDLYREADLALYRAKDGGRDQYALFDDELRARVVARMDAETLLRRAIAEDRIVPRYQPIIDLVDGRLVAVEALARIEDPDRGIVTPDAFVDVAEETGLIVELDARMFELAVAQFSRWAAPDGVALRRLSANVSARSLEDPGFVDLMRSAMSRYGVPGSAVRVELTERSLLTSSPTVHESLNRIAELGVGLGLDDFGTGYSALAYLQRFQLDFLKVDRSFVSRLGHSARDDVVVASVIGLAQAHELIVIAEGVETPNQLAALRRMGCDRAQGFLFGAPMTVPELDSLLRSDPRW